MPNQRETLRVALVAGELTQNGAEKQLVYMASALQRAGVWVQIYSLTQGQFYEATLRKMNLQPRWIGRFVNPLLRLTTLTMALRQFHPHIVQSGHFFTNLYAAIAGRLCGAIPIGAIRNDMLLELKANGAWGPWLLRMPPALIANTYAGKRNAEALVGPETVYLLPNVIDLHDFDRQANQGMAVPLDCAPPVVMAVGRLASEKRMDRFLMALAAARRTEPNLKGILVGDGEERLPLEALARELGLVPDGVLFAGHRADVPAILRNATMLALSSEHEGFPNILLEAMAARVPAITTPAGDAEMIVLDGITGYVVSFDNIEVAAGHMVRLAQSPALCAQLGNAGRQRAEQVYGSEGLADRMFSIYHSIAERRRCREVLTILSA